MERIEFGGRIGVLKHCCWWVFWQSRQSFFEQLSQIQLQSFVHNSLWHVVSQSLSCPFSERSQLLESLNRNRFKHAAHWMVNWSSSEIVTQPMHHIEWIIGRLFRNCYPNLDFHWDSARHCNTSKGLYHRRCISWKGPLPYSKNNEYHKKNLVETVFFLSRVLSRHETFLRISSRYQGHFFSINWMKQSKRGFSFQLILIIVAYFLLSFLCALLSKIWSKARRVIRHYWSVIPLLFVGLYLRPIEWQEFVVVLLFLFSEVILKDWLFLFNENFKASRSKVQLLLLQIIVYPFLLLLDFIFIKAIIRIFSRLVKTINLEDSTCCHGCCDDQISNVEEGCDDFDNHLSNDFQSGEEVYYIGGNYIFWISPFLLTCPTRSWLNKMRGKGSPPRLLSPLLHHFIWGLRRTTDCSRKIEKDAITSSMRLQGRKRILVAIFSEEE